MALGYQNPFYLKQAQQKQQSLYNGKVLFEKHDPPAVYDSEETLQLAQESHTLDSLSQKLENENVELEFQVVKSNDLSNPVTLDSAPSSQELTVVNNERVIAPGIFRINPFKASRVDNFVPNKHVKASVRTKPITVSQPHVITKKDVNSNTNGFSPKNVEGTTRTRRPHPRNNPKNDKLAIRNEKSEVICATCKQCLNTANLNECVLHYVNGMKSIKKNQSANVSKSVNQNKHKENVKKSKKLGSKERLASPRPSKPRTYLKWLPTGRIFDLSGTITESSNTEIEFYTFVFDTVSASNPQDPTNKGFPSSTSFIDRF
ncbi:hypothetical protein Tco_0851474 [Tanacetum coccineum]